ncbi:hypothetical protein VTI28DRAFT_5799 [Corynascus sepedonium]
MSKPAGLFVIEREDKDEEVELLASLGLQRGEDGLISWRADSKDHPRNWTALRKTFDTTVIIFLEFFVTVVSTAGASAAHAAQSRDGMGNASSILAFTFMYLCPCQALGGLVTPALSELIGRRTPYLVACIAFSAACLLTGLAPNSSIPHASPPSSPSSSSSSSLSSSPSATAATAACIWVGRFVAGFASAVPAVVTAGSVHDMFGARRRVWLVAVWNAGSTAGLCLGPVYGAYILAACGGDGDEWRPSRIMKRKLAELREQISLGEGPAARVDEESLNWFNPDHAPDARMMVKLVIVQPLQLLGTEPIVIMVTIISAVSWGIIYLFTESLPDVYLSMSEAGFTRTTSSLAFLALLPGVGLSFLPRLWDQRVVRKGLQRSEGIQPEDKIIGFAVAAPALAIGLIWFSWTVPPAITSAHWMVPTAALVPVGFAVNEMAYTLSAYLTDAYQLYAASAFCGLAFVRALVSGLMPLVAQQMYPRLGANVAGTIVACFALVFCLAPWIFFRYGKRLRERSPFAKHSLESHRKSQIHSPKASRDV